MADFTDLDEQRLDILAGVRTDGSRQQQAVRRQDLQAVMSLTQQTSQRLAPSATITVADYNLIVNDLTKLWQAFAQITARIK